jgi:hypothetical protein
MERMIPVIFLVLLIPCCSSPPSDRFSMQPEDMRFFEYVSESPGSFKEYLVISNGVSLVKNHVGRDNAISVGRISRDDSFVIIEKGLSQLKERNKGVDCSDCSMIHLFYADDRGTQAYSVLAQNASDIRGLEGVFSVALKNLSGVNQFYVHFLFQKQGGDIVDYHFFPEGSIIRSVFGPGNGELKEARFYSIGINDLSDMRSMAPSDVLSSKDDMIGCVSAGLMWGTVEVYRDGKYALINTCGTGESAADKLFSFLMKRCGE